MSEIRVNGVLLEEIIKAITDRSEMLEGRINEIDTIQINREELPDSDSIRAKIKELGEEIDRVSSDVTDLEGEVDDRCDEDRVNEIVDDAISELRIERR